MPEDSKGDEIVKSAGIVRRVDEIGRLVLPVGLRQTLDIKDNDSLEILTDKDHIILRKFKPACLFCGTSEEIRQFKGKNVCSKCLQSMGQKAV